MSADLVLVGAQRRITLMLKTPESRKPVPITFWPVSKEHPNRVNRCPRDVWMKLMNEKKGSPRQDGDKIRSPLEEYMETGLLWEMNPSLANAVKDGKARSVSPQGPNGGAYRPKVREPQPIEGLEHAAELNSVSVEQMQIEVPE